MVKNPIANELDVREQVGSLAWGRSLGGGHGQPTPVFLSGESREQRNMAGYSSWGCRVGHD